MNRCALLIDEYACWGCKTCEVACKQENHQPDGINYIYVSEDGPKKAAGRLEFTYRINVCRHCDAPPCAEACPEDALSKDPETGIVLCDQDKCTGCRGCVQACPHDAIRFDETREVALKCDLCYSRITNGLYPACADNICLAHCIYFGDLAEIEEKILEKRKMREGWGK
jgi:Fe-S-cluster-containing dehydrogenase component